MKPNYPSERMNIWPEAGVESLTCTRVGGRRARWKKTNHRKVAPSKDVPLLIIREREGGMRKKNSGGAEFLELQLWLAAWERKVNKKISNSCIMHFIMCTEGRLWHKREMTQFFPRRMIQRPPFSAKKSLTKHESGGLNMRRSARHTAHNTQSTRFHFLIFTESLMSLESS